MDLIAIDTHDLGHGISGGLEKQGQEYMVKLFADMGAVSYTHLDVYKRQAIV